MRNQEATPPFSFARAVELSFYFWQYGGAPFCARVPAPGAPAEETFGFLDGVVGIAFTYGDIELDYFAAYYYQDGAALPAVAPTTHGGLRGVWGPRGPLVPEGSLY